MASRENRVVVGSSTEQPGRTGSSNKELIQRLRVVRARNVVRQARQLQRFQGGELTMDEILPLLESPPIDMDTVLTEFGNADIEITDDGRILFPQETEEQNIEFLQEGYNPVADASPGLQIAQEERQPGEGDENNENNEDEAANLSGLQITQGGEQPGNNDDDGEENEAMVSEPQLTNTTNTTASGSAGPSRPLRLSRPPNTPETMAIAAAAGLGKSHQKTASPYEIQQAMTPEKYNCSVRISNLPLKVTDKEVLALVKDGKVASFRLSSDARNNQGADLVFTSRASAESFLSRLSNGEGVVLRGRRLSGKFNQMKRAPIEPPEGIQTRVLHVKGPAKDLSLTQILDFLQNPSATNNIVDNRDPLNIVDSRELITPNGSKLVVLEFACIRGESTNATKCLNDGLAAGIFSNLKISYGPDPCQGKSDLHESTWRGGNPKKADKKQIMAEASSWRSSK